MTHTNTVTNERQRHLTHASTVNLGAYYTMQKHVQMVWHMLKKYVSKNTIILDSACGYGGFLSANKNHIGYDIDEEAIEHACKKNVKATFCRANSLSEVSRKKFNIASDAQLVIVGNPPFNDRTSQIRQNIKREPPRIDEDIRGRDIGMSFMKSFNKLKADAVCILHPLSYLIKAANFAQLKNFTQNYALKDAHIISSGEFCDNSKANSFPVVIALYVRDSEGMSYEQMQRFEFSIDGGKKFAMNDFQYIDSFIQKYPRQRQMQDLDDVMFYTLRDINALRRNRTFVFEKMNNAVFIDKTQLDYYIYVDVFKKFIHHVPYYFGNSNILIDNELFSKYKKCFYADAASRYPQLKKHIDFNFKDTAQHKVEDYFYHLLGEHYEN